MSLIFNFHLSLVFKLNWAMARFLSAAERFLEDLLKQGTTYKTSITEDTGTGDDPSKRIFKVRVCFWPYSRLGLGGGWDRKFGDTHR